MPNNRPDLIRNPLGDGDVEQRVLTAKQQAVADELDRLPMPALAKLAKDLPYDVELASRLFVRHHAGGRMQFISHEEFLQGMDYLATRENSVKRRRQLVVYCACVARHGMSKLLLEVEDLKRRELAIITRIDVLAETAVKTPLPAFLAAFKGEDTDGDVHGVPGQGPGEAGVPGGDPAPALGGT